jgi:hypothetical protein
MLSNNDIQAALLSYLKSKSTITSEVTNPDGIIEIREDQWQGTDFDYPCIRIRLISNVPQTSECDKTNISVSFLVFTEDASSQNSDKIAGIINTILHDKQFTSNGISFYLRTTNLIPAIRSSTITWRSEILMNGTAN